MKNGLLKYCDNKTEKIDIYVLENMCNEYYDCVYIYKRNSDEYLEYVDGHDIVQWSEWNDEQSDYVWFLYKTPRTLSKEFDVIHNNWKQLCGNSHGMYLLDTTDSPSYLLQKMTIEIVEELFEIEPVLEIEQETEPLKNSFDIETAKELPIIKQQEYSFLWTIITFVPNLIKRVIYCKN